MQNSTNVFVNKGTDGDDLSDISQSDADYENEYDNSMENEEDKKLHNEFQESVKKYITYDNQIKQRENEIAELKKQKKPVEQIILTCFDKFGETMIEITGGKLRKNKSETKIPLTMDIIKSALQEKLKDPKDVEYIMEKIENRQKVSRVNLKRTVLRKK